MDYFKTFAEYEELITDSYRIAHIINDEIRKIAPNDVIFDFESAEMPKAESAGVVFTKWNNKYDPYNRKTLFEFWTWLVPGSLFGMSAENIRMFVREQYPKETYGWKYIKTNG